ncbi:hypothetical protein IEQ34_000328 [Dendrobium chrysotoxum]|uniref:Uncharacterized protein n=1 Tax=Dendrobium chrysotoxum TaxID=161865 RepID=A0AAV7HR12_DENCH|nr:hypothetical protein IEQ34_000328 [Dendrobium chrysotoxum]
MSNINEGAEVVTHSERTPVVGSDQNVATSDLTGRELRLRSEVKQQRRSQGGEVPSQRANSPGQRNSDEEQLVAPDDELLNNRCLPYLMLALRIHLKLLQQLRRVMLMKILVAKVMLVMSLRRNIRVA